MDGDIRARIGVCEVCTLSKPALNTKISLLASQGSMCLMECLYIDFIEKLPGSSAGNAYVLVVVFFFIFLDVYFTGSYQGTCGYVIKVHFFLDWSSPVYCL